MFGKVSRIRRCISSADGDPPKLTLMTESVSKSWRSGNSHTLHTIVGTAVQMLTRSRSMSPSAPSGVNLPSIMTSLRPPSIPTTNVEWHPATWNSGALKRATGCVPGGVGLRLSSPSASSVSSIEFEVRVNTVFCRFAIMLRCVLIAPFGLPVVPDV